MAATVTPVRTLTEKAITLDMLNDAKQAVISYSKAINEAQNQQLRSVLEQQLKNAVNTQQQVSQFAIQQGYYTPQVQPQQLVQQDIQEAVRVIGQASQMI